MKFREWALVVAAVCACLGAFVPTLMGIVPESLRIVSSARLVGVLAAIALVCFGVYVLAGYMEKLRKGEGDEK